MRSFYFVILAALIAAMPAAALAQTPQSAYEYVFLIPLTVKNITQDMKVQVFCRLYDRQDIQFTDFDEVSQDVKTTNGAFSGTVTLHYPYGRDETPGRYRCWVRVLDSAGYLNWLDYSARTPAAEWSGTMYTEGPLPPTPH